MAEDIEFQIDVPKWSEEPEDARGSRFEGLVKRFLDCQNYKVIERFKTTGSEIDLLCTNSLTGQTAVVECKARRESISSTDVNKIFTDIHQRKCELGLIFYISKLGKETAPKILELNESTDKKIKAIPPRELIENLVRSGSLKLPVDSALLERVTRDLYLLVLREQEVWVRILCDNSGERIGLIGFSANSGERLAKISCPDLSDCDWPFKSLQWNDGENSQKRRPKAERQQVIARVTQSDKWGDFLPANPEDFIGRMKTLRELSQYFDDLSFDRTNIRLIGIKGHSGWGKSSLCLKLSSENQYKVSGGTYILPVDCRSATDLNFPDLAFGRLLDECMRNNFILPLFQYKHEPLANPFVSESYNRLFSELRSSKRSIGLIFDQFEEIIHEEGLSDLFQRMRDLALIVDDLKQPIFIGFSWKTDGSVNSDNAGYVFWHSLSDKRKDFTISGFTRDDADEFISHAAKIEGKRIINSSRETLIQQSNGYPWLLKKLTVRALHNDNTDQFFASTDFSESDIKTLLDEDLEDLTEKERSALTFIAKNAPLDSYIVSDTYGPDILKALIDRRIVVRAGNRVTTYWDIFREYLISGKIPPMQTTYVPTLTGRKLIRSIRHIIGFEKLSYAEFAEKLAVGISTADNFVRDLSQMSITIPHRSDSYFDISVETEQQALKCIQRFLERHSIFKVFLDKSTSGRVINYDLIADDMFDMYSFLEANEQTLRSYFKRILSIAVLLGKARRKGSGYVTFDGNDQLIEVLESSSRGETEVFRAHAPVLQVLMLANMLLNRPHSFKEIKEKHLRNSIYALNTLGLSKFEGDMVVLNKEFENIDQVKYEMIEKLKRQDTIVISVEILSETPKIQGASLGEKLSDELELEWTPKTCARYGSAIKSWVKWLQQQQS